MVTKLNPKKFPSSGISIIDNLHDNIGYDPHRYEVAINMPI